jgi:hypothetical protein
MGKRRGWRQQHETELMDYFSGKLAGEAGLHSGFSPTSGGGTPGDYSPPRAVKWDDRTDRSRAAAVEIALDKMISHGQSHSVDVLRVHYTPTPSAAYAGMAGMRRGDIAVAVMSAAVRKATIAWMAEERDRETAKRTADHAATKARIASRIADLPAAIESAKGQEKAKLRRELAALEAPAPEPDIKGEVEEKWNRAPLHSELLATLRRACRDAEDPTPGRAASARRKSARDLRKHADSQAVKDLEAARGQYASVRDAMDFALDRSEVRQFIASIELGLPGPKRSA